jgi:hypothetical protein
MRRAGGVEPIIIDDVFMGFVLEGDGCAEHEYGIESLNWLLGIPASDATLVGIDKRKAMGPLQSDFILLDKAAITETDYSNGAKTKKTLQVLSVKRRFDPDLTSKQAAKDLAKRFATYNRGNDLYGAWDSYEFALMSDRPEWVKNINTLAQALRDGDIAAWTGRFGNNPFSRGGLAIAIPSRIPAEQLNAMREADIDRNNLVEAAAQTKIADRLKDAGLKWFALSPQWVNDEQAPTTDHKVRFFLNPMGQQQNNSGWFTVEQLDQWIDGTGPIPKQTSLAPTI